jgi:hypothetical protein
MILYRFASLSREGVEAIFARYGVENEEPSEPGAMRRGVVREDSPLFGPCDVHHVLAMLGTVPWSSSALRMIGGRLVTEPAESDIGPDGACRCGCGWEQ